MVESVHAMNTIAIAGVGNLGRYLCEEILQSSSFNLIVLSRKVSHLAIRRRVY